MGFILNSRITITSVDNTPKFMQVSGNAATLSKTITFAGVHDVHIKKSVFSYINTATVKIPATERLQTAQGQTITNSTDTAQQFNRGDKIMIELGYEGNYNVEFIGFISRVDLKTPCELECEGFSYLLRLKQFKTYFKNTTLLGLLQYITADIPDIRLDDNIPNIPLTNLAIPNSSGTQVLDYIKQQMHLTVYFTSDNTLYAGLQELAATSTVKYQLRWNTIKDDKLEYHLEKDFSIQIQLKLPDVQGGNVVAKFGDPNGSIKQILIASVMPQSSLQTLALQEYKKIAYTGFRGIITTFLVPYAQPGMIAAIIDNRYPQRNGSYFINSTEVSFGMSGARRNVGIGYLITPNNT